MCSMSAGAAHAAFRRALERRHLAQALAAAHDLPIVALADALEDAAGTHRRVGLVLP